MVQLRQYDIRFDLTNNDNDNDKFLLCIYQVLCCGPENHVVISAEWWRQYVDLHYNYELRSKFTGSHQGMNKLHIATEYIRAGIVALAKTHMEIKGTRGGNKKR